MELNVLLGIMHWKIYSGIKCKHAWCIDTKTVPSSLLIREKALCMKNVGIFDIKEKTLFKEKEKRRRLNGASKFFYALTAITTTTANAITTIYFSNDLVFLALKWRQQNLFFSFLVASSQSLYSCFCVATSI